MEKNKISLQIEKNFLPRHVAFIMDGNRRWAKEQGKNIAQGHFAGVENLEKIIQNCIDFDIKIVTFFMFSIENWNREKNEVSNLLKIFEDKIDSNSLEKQEVTLKFVGNLAMLPRKLLEKVQKINIKNEQKISKISVNLAISYSGQDEILRAQKIANSENLSNFLDIQEPVDLLIRTGGEMRISNFLLWQTAYTELFFSHIKWPEFDYYCFLEALCSFINRKRRYGL